MTKEYSFSEGRIPARPRSKRRREAGVGGGGSAVVIGGSGNGQIPDLSGFATMDWVRGLTWWGQSLPQNGTDIVGALTGVTSISMTGAISGATGLTLNSGAISGVTTLTASGRATVESLRIGDGVLKWNSQNNAFYVEKADGSVASFYATGSVSALGFSASGGGGGGATELDDLDDVALTTPQTGQVLMYDSQTGKWYNGAVQSSSGAWADITGKPTSIGGYGITDAYISNGTITLGSNSITPLTSLPSHNHDSRYYISNGTITLGSNSITPLTSLPSHNHDSRYYISNGTITLGSNSITPLTSLPGHDHDSRYYISNGTITLGGNSITPLTSLPGHDHDSRYYISNGTITLGGNSITPLTSFTETDPTVPSWAKQSTKPSYSFSEITGSVAFSQLPTLYWANVQISNQSNNNASPQFGNVRIRPGSANYGGYLRFGDGDYAYITEPVDDKLTYKAGWHNFVTGQVNAAVGLRIGGTVSGSSLSGGGLIEWDSSKNAIKVNGNIYATGFVSALGAGSGVGTAQLQTLTLTGDGTGKGLYITDGDIELESGMVYAESGFRTIDSYGFGTTTDVAEMSYNSNVGFVFTGGPIGISGQNNNAGIYMNGSRLYFDSSRYIYSSNGHLYFYNGSTTITLA